MPSSPETYSNQHFSFDPIQRKCTVRGVDELPPEIFEFADEIEILDASFGRMRSLPDNLGDLKNLRIGFFSNNEFESVPEVLASCNSLQMVGFKSCKIDHFKTDALPLDLRGLILTDNNLSHIPENIGDLVELQKLMLTGNRLSVLPQSLLNCTNLELVRLSLNQMQQSPDWLFALPRLAWYSDSGNPFNRKSSVQNAPTYTASDLELYEVLGKSAKNIVYNARLNGRPVAVKIFGEGLTTDGSPMDDLEAALLAGEHPNVIGAIGQLLENSQESEGFIMPLIPAEYRSLGLPPDFKTLTRDVFPEGTTFTDAFTNQVLRDIASAMAHISSRGIMHGDIYAHNILCNADGRSYIGDFGASSIHTIGSETHTLRERVEIRAFGCLIDDMLTLNPSPSGLLTDLRDACLSLDTTSRPKFEELKIALHAE